MMVLAEEAPAWGGVIAGVVALVVFAAFSVWIVVQRLRAKDSVQRLGSEDSAQRLRQGRGRADD